MYVAYLKHILKYIKVICILRKKMCLSVMMKSLKFYIIKQVYYCKNLLNTCNVKIYFFTFLENLHF